MAARFKTFDLAGLKAAARGRWSEILVSLGGCPAEVLDGKHHPCPKCGGTDRFRMVDEDAGACFCNQCLSKKNGDGIAALEWLTGKGFGDTIRAVADYLGVEPQKNGQKKKSEPKVFATAKGLMLWHIGALERRYGPGVKLAGRWNYGTFWVLRYDLPTPSGEKQQKSFRPVYQTPLGTDGVMGWTSGYPAGPRLLYRSVTLAGASDTSLAVISGGEKATDAAARLGLVATTNAGGEQAIRDSDWSPVLRFDVVAIVVDNDPAGEKFGATLAAKIKSFSENEKPKIKIVRLPGLPPKGDIVEWIDAGGTREKFLEIVGGAEETVGDPLASEREVCAAIKIDVLGEQPDGKIKIFSAQLGKTITLPSISKVSYYDMLQMFGPIVKEKVHQANEGIPDMYSIRTVKESIAIIGGSERAGEGIEVGQGVWRGEPGADGHHQIVLVGPGKVSVWDGAKLTTSSQPRAAGLKVDMDAGADAQWYEPERLQDYLAQSASKEWATHAIEQTMAIFNKWYWRNDTGVTSELLSGLVAATWVQSIWNWRPLVSITGASDSGKTVLFETIETFFGKLALLSSKSTEAGIRQKVGNTSKIILCDEFESDKHRQQILELFRTSSRGSRTLRGIIGTGARGQGYGLRHICWVTAIEIGLARSPDRNRFIILELTPPPAGVRGKLNIPSNPEIEDLGQKLLAISIRYGCEADELSKKLKGHVFDGIHGRVVESFSVPCALLSTVMRFDEAMSVNLMKAIFAGLEQDPTQGTKDEIELMGDILSSIVILDRGDRASVGQILAAQDHYTGGLDALERAGIAPAMNRTWPDTPQPGETWDVLFVDHKTVNRQLLAGTQWVNQSIDQLLKRIPGARKCQRRISGHRPWGIDIPWTLMEEKFLQKARREF